MKLKNVSVKVLIGLIISCGLSSCNGPADKDLCLASVRKAYPNSKIYIDPTSTFTFYVVDSTGLWRVFTNNLSGPSISDIEGFIEVK